MKISSKEHVLFTSDASRKIQADWNAAAAQVSIEYGIMVETYYESEGMLLTRIFFQVMGHQFDSLRDLKKALENKAFI